MPLIRGAAWHRPRCSLSSSQPSWCFYFIRESQVTGFPPPSPRGHPFLPARHPSLPQPRCPRAPRGDPAARPVASLPFGGLAPTRLPFKDHNGAEGKESFAGLRVLRLKTQHFRPWSVHFLDQDKLHDLFLALREQNESPARVPPSPLQTKAETSPKQRML